MAQMDNSKASPEAIKSSKSIWEGFIKLSIICGGVVIAALILMALFLV